MPPSISHEGYSDKPAYSYWDDFWALAGYRDAVDIARALGETVEAERLAGSRDGFQRDLLASIDASVARHRIDYLPGAADRGDFDATSTTIALDPGGSLASLPRALVNATFERYWREFVQRRDGAVSWDAYTPYEWRNVGAFARLGWRDRIPALLDFFMKDRRPAGWNQWAEVVGRDTRAPRFIGDMPHAWVSADFIRSVLDLFAYERPADRAIVLAAGIPVAWMGGRGIAIEGLRTPWGLLGYSLRHEGARLDLTVKGPATLPPGGLAFPWPFAGPPRRILVDGRPAELRDGEIRLDRVPARVVAWLR